MIYNVIEKKEGKLPPSLAVLRIVNVREIKTQIEKIKRQLTDLNFKMNPSLLAVGEISPLEF